MKVRVQETDFVFVIELIAESLEEAAWIMRFQVNIKRERPIQEARASKDGEFQQWFSFARKKEGTSTIRSW